MALLGLGLVIIASLAGWIIADHNTLKHRKASIITREDDRNYIPLLESYTEGMHDFPERLEFGGELKLNV